VDDRKWVCLVYFLGPFFFGAKYYFLSLQAKAGYYDECIETSLLNQLVDADLYLLFRFSLDDNTEIVFSASLLALRNLLWNHPDEVKCSVT
jgi:hypothetical protein